MNNKSRSLTLDLHASEFVARYTNHLDVLIEQRFSTLDPTSVYKITEFWREIDRLEKLYQDKLNEMQKCEFQNLDGNVSN